MDQQQQLKLPMLKTTCQSCTACCTAFIIEKLNKEKNTKCIHCNFGCSIHETKPYECSSFNCAYIQSNVNNENLRPDKCGIIFEKISETQFLGTIVQGVKLSDTAKKQINSFKSQGYSVLINENY